MAVELPHALVASLPAPVDQVTVMSGTGLARPLRLTGLAGAVKLAPAELAVLRRPLLWLRSLDCTDARVSATVGSGAVVAPRPRLPRPLPPRDSSSAVGESLNLQTNRHCQRPPSSCGIYSCDQRFKGALSGERSSMEIHFIISKGLEPTPLKRLVLTQCLSQNYPSFAIINTSTMDSSAVCWRPIPLPALPSSESVRHRRGGVTYLGGAQS